MRSQRYTISDSMVLFFVFFLQTSLSFRQEKELRAIGTCSGLTLWTIHVTSRCLWSFVQPDSHPAPHALHPQAGPGRELGSKECHELAHKSAMAPSINLSTIRIKLLNDCRTNAILSKKKKESLQDYISNIWLF